jgi:hypothetical protein
MAFISRYPKFADRAIRDVPVEQTATDDPPVTDLAEGG